MTKPHDELLACPFCGDPMTRNGGLIEHVVQTPGCPIRQNAIPAENIAAWNTRPAHPQAGEVVAGVGDDLRAASKRLRRSLRQFTAENGFTQAGADIKAVLNFIDGAAQ